MPMPMGPPPPLASSTGMGMPPPPPGSFTPPPPPFQQPGGPRVQGVQATGGASVPARNSTRCVCHLRWQPRACVRASSMRPRLKPRTAPQALLCTSCQQGCKQQLASSAPGVAWGPVALGARAVCGARSWRRLTELPGLHACLTPANARHSTPLCPFKGAHTHTHTHA